MATKQQTNRSKPKLHIRKGDTVMVMAGDDKGKTGAVIQVIPAKMRAVVDGINIVKKHTKATQDSEGGIMEMPAPVHVSNLSLLDPKSGEPTRVGRRMENGEWVRYSKKSGNIIK